MDRVICADPDCPLATVRLSSPTMMVEPTTRVLVSGSVSVTVLSWTDRIVPRVDPRAEPFSTAASRSARSGTEANVSTVVPRLTSTLHMPVPAAVTFTSKSASFIATSRPDRRSAPPVTAISLTAGEMVVA